MHPITTLFETVFAPVQVPSRTLTNARVTRLAEDCCVGVADCSVFLKRRWLILSTMHQAVWRLPAEPARA